MIGPEPDVHCIPAAGLVGINPPYALPHWDGMKATAHKESPRRRYGYNGHNHAAYQQKHKH